MYILSNNYTMNKIIENEDNNSQGSNNSLTSNSDTQDFISSLNEEIKSGAHQKFIDNKFLGCNTNENNKRVKRTRNRPSKAERFSEEREELIKELSKIIGLENNNKIILYDLEHNEELKTYLKENVCLIRKLFKTCTWGYFSNDKKKGMGNEIGLLRAIYKNEGWEISSKRKMCERNGKKSLFVELHLNKYLQ